MAVVAGAGGNASKCAGSVRRADAAAAAQYSSFRPGFPNRLAHSQRDIRIVDRIRPVRAHIEHVMAALAQARRHGILQLVTTMVSAHGYPHVDSPPSSMLVAPPEGRNAPGLDAVTKADPSVT